eukprot:3500318-Pyramimonas_sp.AAC.1
MHDDDERLRAASFGAALLVGGAVEHAEKLDSLRPRNAAAASALLQCPCKACSTPPNTAE